MINKNAVLNVLSDQTLSRGALVVFLFLQMYQKPWVAGQYELSNKVGLSRLTVLEALKSLEERGYIVRKQNPIRKNHQIIEIRREPHDV